MASNNLQDLKLLAAAAIRMVRHQPRWKPGKDLAHLEKRIRRGHFSPGTSMVQYNQLIQNILNEHDSEVYHYAFGQADYFSITHEIENRPWLVLISAKGMMETAFPPEDLQEYISKNKYVLLGKLKEIVL